MSIESVGFSPWETISARDLMRVTIAFPWFAVGGNNFDTAAQALYNQLRTGAGLTPTTYLHVVAGDRTAVIDALPVKDVSGADLLNKLDSLGSLLSMSAIVSRVEKLSDADRAKSSGGDGEAARTAAQKEAQRAAEAGSAIGRLVDYLKSLGTVAKIAAAVVALGLVAYLVHEVPHRK